MCLRVLRAGRVMGKWETEGGSKRAETGVTIGLAGCRWVGDWVLGGKRGGHLSMSSQPWAHREILDRLSASNKGISWILVPFTSLSVRESPEGARPLATTMQKSQGPFLRPAITLHSQSPLSVNTPARVQRFGAREIIMLRPYTHKQTAPQTYAWDLSVNITGNRDSALFVFGWRERKWLSSGREPIPRRRATLFARWRQHLITAVDMPARKRMRDCTDRPLHSYHTLIWGHTAQ